jgi:solute carrier family 50 (sugar transporter)
MLSCALLFLYLFIYVPPICGFQVIDSKLRIQRNLNVRGLTNSPFTQASFNSYSFRRKHTSLGLMANQGQYTSFWGIFVTGLQFAGPIFFLSLQFSSVMTAAEITKTKTCGLLSPLPFISLFTNSFVWSLYGMMKMDGTVFIPNSCGVIASLYCILAFHKHAVTKPNKLYIAALVTSSLALCLATAGKCPLIGVLGCFLSVLLSGSPLAVMKTVVQEKSTTALPFTTSFVIWLNSISWLLYGVLVAHDILIYGPNILGFLLASVQMSLFAIYGIKPAVKSAEVVSKI